MINAVVDRNITEMLREALDKAVEQGALDLVFNTTERRAGRVQGLHEALELLNQLVQQTNDQRSSQQVN